MHPRIPWMHPLAMIRDEEAGQVLEEVAAVELQRRLAEPDPPLLVDVRTDEERALARIDPSLHISLQEFLERAPREIPRDAEVVVYCHSGMRSAQATLWMLRNGWSRVRNLEGGIDAWSVLVDPGTPRY
jgi:rhodanese-related sulfurtransferase